MIIGIILLLFCCYMYYRNYIVYKEQLKIIKKIENLISADLYIGKDSSWRWEEFEKISYVEMLFKIWIPVENFYKNHKCISSIDNN